MKKYSFSIRNNEDFNVCVENIEAINEQQAMDKVLQMLTESIKHKALVKEYTYDEKDRIVAVKHNNGFWLKQQFNDNDDIVYYENSDGYWAKYEYDDRGNEIYYENSNGYWVKSKYDDHGNRTYYEDSDGFWVKSEYDDHGNETYREFSDGKSFGTPRAELEQEPDITDD